MKYSQESIQAAKTAEEKIFVNLVNRKHFLLEAGAGAGKTHALIESLKFLINNQGHELARKGKRIACITFTNVAANEISERIGNHPAVWVSTIHGFCWEIIRKYQPELHVQLQKITNWTERISRISQSEYEKLPIQYDLGYSKIEEDRISIGHANLLQLASEFFAIPKFKRIISNSFPFWFVDEYQDTNEILIKSILTNFIRQNTGPTFGFFGDNYQRIYAQSFGKIEESNVEFIGKGVNFRSGKKIVDVLNQLRPELTQVVANTDLDSDVKVFHTNSWDGERLTNSHWKGDLPQSIAHEALSRLKSQLEKEGWEFDGNKSKVLMLTNNVLAKEQGYGDIGDLLTTNEYLDLENPILSFLVKKVDPVNSAYAQKNFGELFSLLDGKPISIRKHRDKEIWSSDLKRLAALSENGTIGQVFDLLQKTKKPRITQDIIDFKRRFKKEQKKDISSHTYEWDKYTTLMDIPIQQVFALAKFLNDSTPFSTKHGVKGAEFENVLVVLGRGWNLYNWNRFLEQYKDPENLADPSVIRNRNLFYVACSRPKKRLSLLFTQELSDGALATLRSIFAPNPILDLFDAQG